MLLAILEQQNKFKELKVTCSAEWTFKAFSRKYVSSDPQSTRRDQHFIRIHRLGTRNVCTRTLYYISCMLVFFRHVEIICAYLGPWIRTGFDRQVLFLFYWCKEIEWSHFDIILYIFNRILLVANCASGPHGLIMAVVSELCRTFTGPCGGLMVVCTVKVLVKPVSPVCFLIIEVMKSSQSAEHHFTSQTMIPKPFPAGLSWSSSPSAVWVSVPPPVRKKSSLWHLLKDVGVKWRRNREVENKHIYHISAPVNVD